MTILVSPQTRLAVVGITGHAASHHAQLMRDYGTQVVAGVRPGAGGTLVHHIPVFDTMKQAVHRAQANAAILFVPARSMKNAAFETVQAGVKLVVMVSEHVPLHDTMEIIAFAAQHNCTLIGPNTPGLIAPPAKVKIGFVPASYYMPGPVGVASRSGTLTYEIVSRLTQAGIGQTCCVGVGGDAMVGSPFVHLARKFQDDPQTQAMLFVGEVGGSMEEELADAVKSGEITKPVLAYLAGRTAPEGKRMGHAGAIVAAGRGSMASKLSALDSAGIPVAAVPQDVVPLVQHALRR